MNRNHLAGQKPDQLTEEDLVFKGQLRSLPDPEPSHGFDMRVADMLMHDPRVRPASQGNTLRVFFGLPWGRAAVLGAILAAVAVLSLQWLPQQEDLTKVDLLVLMSQELL